MRDRSRTSRTPRTAQRRRTRPRTRRHHADLAFGGGSLFELTAEEIMLDLAPGWPSVRREQPS